MATRKASDSNLTGKKYIDASAGATKIVDVPDLPTVSSVTNPSGRAYNSAAAVVALTANARGGVPATYTVVSSPGSVAATGTSPITVTGLTAGTSYTFTAYATAAAGNSPTTGASSSVTPTTVPATPTISSATGAGTGALGRLIATFSATANSAPTNGGSSITSHTITTTPATQTFSSVTSPYTLTGLTSGTTYTVNVFATNAQGNSGTATASGIASRYTCPSGGTLQGSTCATTTSYGATYQPDQFSICPSGKAYKSGGNWYSECYQYFGGPAGCYSIDYNGPCPNWQYFSGTGSFLIAPGYYYCPSGGTLQGSNCSVATSYGATIA
jgi:hypothetical protein